MSGVQVAGRVASVMPEGQIVLTLCVQYRERAEALMLRGKRRDDEALAFFTGAAEALRLVGNVRASQRLLAFVFFRLVSEGYRAVLETIDRAAERVADVMAEADEAQRTGEGSGS